MTTLNKQSFEWALYIDIEGFSAKFEQGAKDSFIKLTNDLFTIGSHFYDYLSIEQFGGDGFLLKQVSIRSPNFEKPIELATLLLKLILLRGGIGRVQISHGYMADTKGLYSDEIQNSIRMNGSDNLLNGKRNIMGIKPLIGTSIINAHKLKGPSGPLLLVDVELESNLIESRIPFTKLNFHNQNVLSVNWVKFDTERIQEIVDFIGLNSSIDYTQLVKNYIQNNSLTNEWIQGAVTLIQNN